MASHFYPRPPRGGRQAAHSSTLSIFGFLSTPSARRATASTRSLAIHPLISIHALREEGDDAATLTLRAQIAFLSTPSARRATCWQGRCRYRRRYFYPRPPRGGRPQKKRYERGRNQFLSTPSARRATAARSTSRSGDLISIHALREEGDNSAATTSEVSIKFLSTPSARRATAPHFCRCQHPTHFYPRPPRGGRRAGRLASTCPI